jgi:uncharacterized protein (DUF2252 family)
METEATPASTEADVQAVDSAPGEIEAGDGLPRTGRARRVEHLTTAERVEKGRAARKERPRQSHGEWEPASTRLDPVALLEEQGQTRLTELVPIRYGRMLVSPFTFYRGAAYLMAADLAATPQSGLRTQLCGDMHLSNLGGFAAPDRRLVFSINDFDETLPGPFEWDVKRLVTSFAVAGRDRGFDEATREAINRTVARAYRKELAGFAALGNLALWYARIDLDEIEQEIRGRATKQQLKRYEKNVAKARTKDSLKAFTKLTEVVDGELRIVSDPPVITTAEDVLGPENAHRMEEILRLVIRTYRGTLPDDRRKLLERYRFLHAARKVVGVGSVGTRAWILLFVGRDEGDPLFLQFKEAQTSVLEPFLGKAEYPHHGKRVVEGQRLMQASSDIMLGWTQTDDLDGVRRDFYVRQLWDSKWSPLVELMEPSAMTFYARMCGTELARAHARAGDPIAIAGYLGKSDVFDRAMAAFAELYADQNDRDYEALRAAVASGRVTAQEGV